MNKDSKEYKKAYSQANRIYGEKSSLYRSAFIVKTYKELGGKFTGKKPVSTGLKRWIEKEQWVHVIPYLTSGKIVMCGSTERTEPCRPLKRATDKTPITIKELLKIHSKKDILNAAKQKKNDPQQRLTWKTLNLN
jgi:hypothetical protein